MTVFERIEELRKSKKISQGKLEKELGFSNGSISKWKTSTPNSERLQKLADYFGVSSEYLMTGKESANYEIGLRPKDERDISKKLNETLDQLVSNDGLMFDGEVMDDETKELLKISLESAIRTAKITAKKKYTPKKYRTDK